MNSNNKLLYKTLTEFYKNNNNYNILNNIINDKKISLLVIDRFVTNYSKKNNIQYIIYKNNDNKYTIDKNNKYIKQMNVFTSYKSQLKSYSKKYFDPFCRRDRIKHSNLDTTIGQLNFFKWAIENLILEYIYENYNDIENDMNDSIKLSNKSKIKGVRKPRKELSKSAYKGLSRTNHKVIIRFE